MNMKPEFLFLLKQPSAWIPIVSSVLALAMIFGYVAVFGIVQNEDEGAPARIFQLLMGLQLPIIAFFALEWLPKRPVQALLILAFQAVAWIVPIATILWLERV